MPATRNGGQSLTPPPDTGPRLSELKLWLRGLIRNPDFFAKHPRHSLPDLHFALYLAIIELVTRLEPQLEAVIHAAQDEDHNIQLKVDDFEQDRKLDTDGLHEVGLAGIKRMSRQAAVKSLVMARDEIEWVDNETKRLEVHADNAKELRQSRFRKSFEYRPMPRNVRGPVDWYVGEEGDGEGVGGSLDVKLGDDSDDEMLEFNEEDHEMGRRDSANVPLAVLANTPLKQGSVKASNR